MSRRRILYVTDLHYQANGRVYRDEDLFVTGRLGEHFDLALCGPTVAESLMDGFDAVVVRNSGPVIHHQLAYDSFRSAALDRRIRVFNELTGKADMLGKQYLVDLSAAGAAVIPTIDCVAGLDRLPEVEAYITKPKLGADSIGMRRVPHDELSTLDLDGSTLVQPLIDFVHEVSFYVVGDELIYALHAPDPLRRWELQPFEPSSSDRSFASAFIEWNDIRYGIQRVDACRTADGQLLLMELEDLNPYLSLDVVDADTRDRFLDAMRRSIKALITSN
ncbi:MAG: hypothetical protein ABIR32_12275 [Ilumatobacteraceae bacterium]